MEIVHAVLALTAACIGFALIARTARLPYAVILVLGGMALAFIPGVPAVELDPDLALAFFLPPLLMASAWRTDWRAFRAHLRPILLLAVGAVLFSAIMVALVAKLLLPGLPFAAALALGAIIAPPDAVAAGAVLARLKLPRRLSVVIEGESLVNDAAALVLYRFAIAAVAAGSIALEGVAGTFALLAAGGILVGAATGFAANWVFKHLRDPLLDTAASFVACFAGFFAAEAVGVSGVIAVVTAGLLMGQLQHRTLTPETRVAAVTVWRFVEFVLTSLVFILVGLQLRAVLERIADRGILELATLAVAISATLILARFAWVWPAAWLPVLIPGVRRREGTPRHRELLVLSWAGMRGVVSLAAALALPANFPERDLLVFLAFAAILATLVLQGTTLGMVARRARVEERRVPGMDPMEAALRNQVAGAMAAEVARRAEDLLEGPIARDLLAEYQDKARIFSGLAGGAGPAEMRARLTIRLAALKAGRARLLAAHREGGLPDELLAALENEQDLEELRIRRLLGAPEPAR